jgi:hypothetical protein
MLVNGFKLFAKDESIQPLSKIKLTNDRIGWTWASVFSEIKRVWLLRRLLY